MASIQEVIGFIQVKDDAGLARENKIGNGEAVDSRAIEKLKWLGLGMDQVHGIKRMMSRIAPTHGLHR